MAPNDGQIVGTASSSRLFSGNDRNCSGGLSNGWIRSRSHTKLTHTHCIWNPRRRNPHLKGKGELRRTVGVISTELSFIKASY